MTALAGTEADLYIAALPAVPFSNEACTDDGDGITFSIDAAAKRFWDPATAVVVEVDDGGGWDVIPAADYTVQHVGGKIIFDADQTGNDVRVDGGYMTVSQLTQATKWSVDIAQELLEVTAFGDSWKSKIAGLKEASASIERFADLDAILFAELEAGNPLVVVLYTDYSAGSRYEGYARIKQVSPSAEHAGTVDESMSLEITGELFYVEA